MVIKIFDFLNHGKKPIQALVIRRHNPKTLMCEVQRREWNRTKYGGLLTKRKNFMVHDEYEKARIGDIVRIKHSKKYSKMKAHAVYDIIKPNEGQAFMEQHPEYNITGSIRKDRKKRAKDFEMSLQDPLTQMRYTREQEEKEKLAIEDRLARLKKRAEAKEAIKAKKEAVAQKIADQKAAAKQKKDEKKESKQKKKVEKEESESEE